jgi:hypothetical protein
MEVSFTRGPAADRQRGRDLIRRMSLENPVWGTTKIHGELHKLGIQVAQSTVSIYMVPRRDRPLQTWKTFVRNHREGTVLRRQRRQPQPFFCPRGVFERLLEDLATKQPMRPTLEQAHCPGRAPCWCANGTGRPTN